MAIVTSGLRRSRRWFSTKRLSGISAGGLRNLPTISVTVAGKFFPAPGIDLQLQSGESFCLRVLGHAVFITVAAELTAHKILLLDGRNRLQHFCFLVTNGVAVETHRRLHRQVRQHLKQMVLYYVA